MKPSLYKVAKIKSGVLYIMPKPSSDWLTDDIQFLKKSGITKIISLLENQEVNELRLDKEKDICISHNMSFEQFPIKDRALPNKEHLKSFTAKILHELNKGEKIAIHCRAGIGRAGLVTCCTLINVGISHSEAISTVANARGCSVPDTAEQLQFIEHY